MYCAGRHSTVFVNIDSQSDYMFYLDTCCSVYMSINMLGPFSCNPQVHDGHRSEELEGNEQPPEYSSHTYHYPETMCVPA